MSGPDVHIKVGHTLYSVPWKLIGRRVDVCTIATMVQVFHDGDLVKIHAALGQGKRTDKSGFPPEKTAFQMRTPIWCRTQASEVGDACRPLVDQLLEVNALHRRRPPVHSRRADGERQQPRNGSAPAPPVPPGGPVRARSVGDDTDGRRRTRHGPSSRCPDLSRAVPGSPARQRRRCRPTTPRAAGSTEKSSLGEWTV
ncbi:hypothetical protein ACGF8B_32240 [Streptomyces sp. NPDC047917]|uniref:Mu transposase domain-containing protein n=1 Tax=Streptomyces sp. NPDC047917 TaxID=3365491 RepID=UPI00371017FF